MIKYETPWNISDDKLELIIDKIKKQPKPILISANITNSNSKIARPVINNLNRGNIWHRGDLYQQPVKLQLKIDNNKQLDDLNYFKRLMTSVFKHINVMDTLIIENYYNSRNIEHTGQDEYDSRLHVLEAPLYDLPNWVIVNKSFIEEYKSRGINTPRVILNEYWMPGEIIDTIELIPSDMYYSITTLPNEGRDFDYSDEFRFDYQAPYIYEIRDNKDNLLIYVDTLKKNSTIDLMVKAGKNLIFTNELYLDVENQPISGKLIELLMNNRIEYSMPDMNEDDININISEIINHHSNRDYIRAEKLFDEINPKVETTTGNIYRALNLLEDILNIGNIIKNQYRFDSWTDNINSLVNFIKPKNDKFGIPVILELLEGIKVLDAYTNYLLEDITYYGYEKEKIRVSGKPLKIVEIREIELKEIGLYIPDVDRVKYVKVTEQKQEENKNKILKF